MKTYLVVMVTLVGEDEFKEPLAAFSSPEKAQSYIDSRSVLANRWFNVKEYEIDAEPFKAQPEKLDKDFLYIRSESLDVPQEIGKPIIDCNGKKIGEVIDVFSKEFVVKIERKLAPKLVKELEEGIFPAVSVGFEVKKK